MQKKTFFAILNWRSFTSTIAHYRLQKRETGFIIKSRGANYLCGVVIINRGRRCATRLRGRQPSATKKSERPCHGFRGVAST